MPAAGDTMRVIPWAVPLVLLVILAASCAMFWALLRRWTPLRRWQELSDFAAANGFTLHRKPPREQPELVSVLGRPGLRVVISLGDKDTQIVQVETPGKSSQDSASRWNVLIRRVGWSWPMAGFRPTGQAASVLDLLPLESLYAMSPGERFVLYAVETEAAAALAKTGARALLPPDVGMILAGDCLFLDFSTRPFDPIELQRVASLAEQLASRLPQSSP
jgi:hypothetical protein